MVSPLYGIGVGLQSLTGGLQQGLERADRLAQINRQMQAEQDAAKTRAAYQAAVLGQKAEAANATRGFRQSQLEESTRHNKALEGVAEGRLGELKNRTKIMEDKAKALAESGGLTSWQKRDLQLRWQQLGRQEKEDALTMLRSGIQLKQQRLGQLITEEGRDAREYMQPNPQRRALIESLQAEIENDHQFLNQMGRMPPAGAPRPAPTRATPQPPTPAPTPGTPVDPKALLESLRTQGR